MIGVIGGKLQQGVFTKLMWMVLGRRVKGKGAGIIFRDCLGPFERFVAARAIHFNQLEGPLVAEAIAYRLGVLMALELGIDSQRLRKLLDEEADGMWRIFVELEVGLRGVILPSSERQLMKLPSLASYAVRGSGIKTWEA